MEQQAQLKARLKNEIRTNTYNPDTKEIVISNDRSDAYRYLSDYYTGLFMNDSNFDQLRDDYAITINTVKDTERMRHMNSFFFWSTWATAANRPGSDITYTNNWPNEQLIDNKPTGEMVVWSVVSFVMLLAGVGALAWYFAVQKRKEPHIEEVYPERDPLLALSATLCHEGYEYVDLGRFWQIFLTVGLFLWLFLMGRALLPAFKKSKEDRTFAD